MFRTLITYIWKMWNEYIFENVTRPAAQVVRHCWVEASRYKKAFSTELEHAGCIGRRISMAPVLFAELQAVLEGLSSAKAMAKPMGVFSIHEYLTSTNIFFTF
ncbi:hypothetical protein Gorai_017744 [Gossypium raimondii]|uniref:Uncharacterized protein n=1 Tax=Gossypium raimondii TaxID=29730 RepID=A0A7J8PIC9_GOSRA|nr:hypothetical protein [Gossypium raimondii]